MAIDYHPTETGRGMDVGRDGGRDGGRGPRAWLRWLILLLIVFAGGAAAMGYVLVHWSAAARYIGVDAGATGADAVIVAAPLAATAPAPVAPAFDAAREAGVERRIAGLEGRLGQIDARASAAVGNADRAEGLLVAFAARRALDRGVALGYIEALLRDRFGTNQPQAVATIMTAARQPVTLEELQAGLSDIAPSLAGGGPDESWLDGMRRELSALVVVRRANVPAPDPADRLARAKRALEAGHVPTALAEVARMPGREAAAGGIASARHYAAARDALDVIETAALLEPRGVKTLPTPPGMARPTDEGGQP